MFRTQVKFRYRQQHNNNITMFSTKNVINNNNQLFITYSEWTFLVQYQNKYLSKQLKSHMKIGIIIMIFGYYLFYIII